MYPFCHSRIEAKEEGDYKICFDNTFSRFSNKLTFFEVITDDPDPNWDRLNNLPDIEPPMPDADYVYDFKLDEFRVMSS